MTDALLTTIQREVEKFSEDITRLEDERTVIDEKINRTKRERDAWQTIYAIRLGESGADNTAIKQFVSVAPPVELEEYGAKSRVMKEHILSSGEIGVTPKSVQEYMHERGLTVSPNFVYKTLNRLKADGEIESIGGVFKPTKSEHLAAQ